jgi:hypothetical protein
VEYPTAPAFDAGTLSEIQVNLEAAKQVKRARKLFSDTVRLT